MTGKTVSSPAPLRAFSRGGFLWALTYRNSLRDSFPLGSGVLMWRANAVLRWQLQALGGLSGAW